MVFFYIRVSDAGQNEGRQLEALKNYYPEVLDENIFIDKESGKDFNREAYKKLKMVARAGDVIILSSLDRFGRNKEMIKTELGEFQKRGVQIKILNIPTTLVDIGENQSWIMEMISNIIIEVLSSFAEEERDMIRQRQREGIELAKKQGKYVGRKKGTSKVSDKEFFKIHRQYQDGGITVDQAIKLLGYRSRTSYYRRAKEYSKNNKS